MKNALTSLNIAVDGAALFVAGAGWVFTIWLPVAFVVIFIRLLRKPGTPIGTLTFIILAAIALSILVGWLLKWLAQGVIERKSVRTITLSCVLGLQGLWQVGLFFLSEKPLFQTTTRPMHHRFTWFTEGLSLLLLSLVTALGATGKAKIVED